MVQRPARDPFCAGAILTDLPKRDDPLRGAVNVDGVHRFIIVFGCSVFEKEVAPVVVPSAFEHGTERGIRGIFLKVFEPDQIVAAVKTVIPRLVCRLAVSPTAVPALGLGGKLDRGFRQREPIEPFRQPPRAREKGSAEKVHIMDATLIVRRVAETKRVSFSRTMKLLQEKLAAVAGQ